MINAEVLELKKRFKKDRASFYRIAGCYVNEKKEKVYTFSQSFLNLPEPEMFKYLEIANKILSGKINNNLINVEFPIEEEKDGGSQQKLYALRGSEGAEENLEELYDKIIANYNHVNHYLIVLFFDKYDVPVKTKDNQKTGESEEVFHYFLCGICPVELTKPNLGFIDKETGLSIVSRDWVVNPPDTGFMFPAFNERSTDIHSILAYTKNSKSPHREIVEDMLGCEYSMTSSEKKERFNEVIKTKMMDAPPEEVNNVIVDFEYKLNQRIDAHKSEYGETAVLKITKAVLDDITDDLNIDDDIKDELSTALYEIFEDTNTDASVLVNAGNMRIGEVRAEKQILANILVQKEKELSEIKAKPQTRFQTKTINGMEYMLVPTEKNTQVIDGVEYVLVPTQKEE